MDNKENYLVLARTAALAGNYEEALNYFNKVLEIDPANVNAWFGKGEASGWLSTVSNLRFGEMTVAFESALKFSDYSDELKKECAKSINEIVTACYSICKNHVIEFVALQDTWTNYIQQAQQMISMYELAHAYDPENKVILENIITLCEGCIEGIAYTDPYDDNMSKSVFLSPEYEKKVREKMVQYGDILKKLDPEYKLPNPVASKPESSCFVVTATMGNEYSYPVITLRKFRDNHLLSNKLGVNFVNWYYKNGPLAAKKIKKSNLLKAASFVFIVMPAVFIAKIIMIFNKK
ncbi:tetratricopeptide repeat protein [Proteus mirabilis]|uniref:tetratricopeptide repeat protein n=1 Tax=Proteus mirabilis TaxID=584 RepID=UPI0018C5D26F|nr:tetratricopeptide repeat protein [Proteus mirabilis]MBG5995224.1 tetratricopeptide repeat protein [Proteus mirabilis]MDC9730683.1 tetratricopeptide repeat protein [Proteus mirabilis]